LSVDFAGAGQPQSSRVTVEQLDAEPALEGLDAVTDGTGSEIELVGRFSEAVVTGSGLEHPKRTQWRKPEGHAVIRFNAFGWAL